MKRASLSTLGLCLLAGLLIAGLIGCSSDAPTEPITDESALTNSFAVGEEPPPAGRVQFVGVVASVNVAERTLTFEEREETVVAAEDCLILEIEVGVTTEIEFGAIEIGDRVKVAGLLQEDGTVLAHRLLISTGQEFCDYDLAFRDAVATIDYAAGSFTVVDRTETILIDENTVIWGCRPCLA